MSTLILVPAYGDYETEMETVQAWNDGKDFVIRTIGVRGTYASIRDMDEITKDFDMVYIRYRQSQEIVTVYSKAADNDR